MLFDRPGPANTEQALRCAVEGAKERGIDTMVVASHSGETMRTLLSLDPKGLRLLCVRPAPEYGSNRAPRPMSDGVRDELACAGVEFVRASHLLSGAERGLSAVFGGVCPVELIAHALRLFCDGMKVCVEIAAMAVDAGLLEAGKRVVAVGGTRTGADTAAVTLPAPASRILDSRVEEVLCKPRAYAGAK